MSEVKKGSFRTAFIRVFAENETKEGLVTYSFEELSNMVYSFCDRYAGSNFAFIEHNRDIDPDGKLKKKHYHIVFRFKNPVKWKYLVEAFPYSDIQSCTSVNASVQYLIHKNNPEKAQYNYAEIISNMSESKLEELLTKTDGSGRKRDKFLEDIINKIDSGEIREYNRFEYIDSYTLTVYASKIKEAFKNRSEKVMRNANRDIKVYFIQGTSGTGKTTYAKQLASCLGNGSYYVSSSKNDSLQDYKGEDVLILDELRDDAFEIDDFLKVLDNHTASSIKSRFFNKSFLGVAIIITSTKRIEEWYNFTKEDRGQLYRRITAYMQMTKEKITISSPVSTEGELGASASYKFQTVREMENPVADYLKASDAVREGDLNSLFSIMEKTADKMKEEVRNMRLSEEKNNALKEKVASLRIGSDVSIEEFLKNKELKDALKAALSKDENL